MKNNEKIVENNKYFIIIKYILIFLSFYVLTGAGINGVLFPFSFAFLFALVWCNQNCFIMAPLFILASFLNAFSISSLIFSSVAVVVMIITYLIHYKLKKPMKPWIISIYLLFAQSAFIWLEISSGTLFVFPIISLIISVVFFFACTKFFEAIIIRGFSSKLTISEMICGASILLAFSCGLAEMNIYDFSVLKLVATIVILISSYTFSTTSSIITGGVVGIGALLSSNNPYFLSAFIIWALAVSCFKLKNRLLPSFALLLCEAALGLYFNIYGTYSVFSFLPSLLGCGLFLLIPNKFIDEVSAFFSSSYDRLAMRNIVNRSRQSLSRRLGELSDTFNEMDKVFRSMIKGGISVEDAKVLLVQDLKNRVCSSCPEVNRCHRAMVNDTEKLFHDFVSIAFERGKLSLLDVPPALTSRCLKSAALINDCNELSKQYKRYAGMLTNLDASKVLVAEQLGGISKIMKNLSQEFGAMLTFDARKEKKIVDELSVNNINCSDVVIYEQAFDKFNATVVVKDESLDVKKIEKCLSKVCSYKMAVFSSDKAPRSGWSVLTLKSAPKYDIVFGTASMTKTSSDMSGDSYSLTRIENDKFMLALCDGMGSGQKAEKSSNLAIGLVENFYKAGFDNDTILSSVNKLLALGNDDIFSALDMCVIDLKKGFADMIKLGAPNGFIKHCDETEIVESGALPLGIVGNISPISKKVVLSDNDIIILATDGITDSFQTVEDLADYIHSCDTKNPQALADEILNRAVENCKGVALDDMTVVACRVFENIN